jgi:hypothetical protein
MEDDYDFVDDEDYGFDGEDDDSFDMATGGRTSPTSQPYIVNVENTTAANINGVTILGSYAGLSGSTLSPRWGNAIGISITMGITGISYAEFLYQAMNKPFVVGLTYYQASGVSASTQILETLTLIQKDVNGNVSQKTLVPTIDPYQQQSGVVAVKFSYKIDGFTSIVIASIIANTTAKLYFYPAETSSVARTLTGRRVVSGYGNPNIVKSEKLQLSARSLRALSGRRRSRRRRR